MFLQHRVAKNTAESAKNVLNITKTLSERQQLRAVSVYYHGMFNTSQVECSGVVTYKSEIQDNTSFNSTLRNFMAQEDFICGSIQFREQTYVTGDLVVVGIEDCDDMDVGLIKAILVKASKVYFVIQRYRCKRMYLQFFVSETPVNDVFEFIEVTKLIDYKPLILRGTINKFVYTLHHHVSHDYKQIRNVLFFRFLYRKNV